MSAALPLPLATTIGTGGSLSMDFKTVWIVLIPPSRTTSTTGIPFDLSLDEVLFAASPHSIIWNKNVSEWKY